MGGSRVTHSFATRVLLKTNCNCNNAEALAVYQTRVLFHFCGNLSILYKRFKGAVNCSLYCQCVKVKGKEKQKGNAEGEQRRRKLDTVKRKRGWRERDLTEEREEE